MPDFDAWDDTPINAAARAEDAWRRIQRNPSSVTFQRSSGAPGAQTVRVEMSNTWTRETTPVNTQTRVDVVVYGVHQHPTVPDTDMKVGDRFKIGAQKYEIQSVLELPGELQGFGERAG